MASNGEIEAEDTEISESNGEKVVTMMDVLQEQEDFEQDANAVLGASDDKNCTYALGYIKRQAIYACMTCCSEAKEDPTKRAGVCLACSLTCHENHELIELYTKRNFRCDCGNPKFNSHPCQFTSNKTDLNEENSYNQNFSGVYCTCHRPYPDPEATEEDEMIQCIICEDWLHASHLEATVPSAQYDEMICKDCMQKNEFLHDYSDLALNSENDYVDVESLDTSIEINGTNKNENEKDANQSNVDVEMAQEEGNESMLMPKIVETKMLEDNKEDGVATKDESAPIDNNDKNGSNTAMDTSNTDTSTVTPPEETKSDEKVDSLAEDIAEDNKTENKCLDEENIDSHINALKEIVESSEEIINKDVNNEEKTEEENKVDTEPKTLETDSKVADPDVIKSSEAEATKETNNENANDETPSVPVPETPTEELSISQNETKNANDENSTNTETETSTDEKESSNEKPDEVNQTIEVPKADNQIESPAPKSAEELEKMEEDKLLEDPDESKQEEISENKVEPQTNESAKDVNEKTSVDTPKEDSQNPELNVQNTESTVSSSVQEKQENDDSEKSKETSTQMESEASNETTNSIDDKSISEETIEKPEIKRKLSCETPDSEAKKRKVENNECKRRKDIKRHCKGATFWPSNFRQKLCTCNECLSMYKDLSVLFLLDSEDTVSAYENLGKEKTNGKPQSQYEKGLQALSSLDRIQQINVLTEYNKMRDKFLDFLKSFKDRRKIVTEDDVKAFFAGMKPTKRPDGVYFCR